MGHQFLLHFPQHTYNLTKASITTLRYLNRLFHTYTSVLYYTSGVDGDIRIRVWKQ